MKLKEIPIKPLSPFEVMLALRVLSVDEGFALVEMPFRKEITQPAGVAHGGAITSLADTAAAIALKNLVGPKEHYFTARLEIRFLCPFKEGKLVAEARIIEKKKRIAIGNVKIRDKKGVLTAKATVTLLIKKIV